jgi:hypothetical protein
MIVLCLVLVCEMRGLTVVLYRNQHILEGSICMLICELCSGASIPSTHIYICKLLVDKVGSNSRQAQASIGYVILCCLICLTTRDSRDSRDPITGSTPKL